MQNTSIGWRVQLGTGIALATMAAVAVRVDVLNNWEYGRTISDELASILVLAAVAVVAVPVAASILGWSRHLRITAAICVALTVWSAVNAYSTKQGAAILSAQSAQAAYTSALADEKAARATLARITETGDADELTKLQALASAEREKACRRSRSDECTSAKAEEKAATARVSDAKARDKAQATLANAKQEAKAGPAEASMVATVIAAQLGADAASVARYIALALTGLGIAVTQLVALLGGQAASLIGGAIKARPRRTAAKQADPEAPAAEEAPAIAAPQKAALDRLMALILNAPDGRIVSSGRKLAELEGVASSTYAGWLAKWQAAGYIEAERAGNRTAIKLGNRRAA
jgi:hypothetical protein